MTKVSIITPAYNSSNFIKKTIETVINQTYKDWEYIIIDDCSTDNTSNIVNDFVKLDSRIKILKTSQNSKGPAVPKNIGIKHSTGEYIAFLDHDDEWLPEKLEKQLQIFKESKNDKLGLVSCFLNIKDKNNNLISLYNKNYKGNIISQLAKGNFILTSSCVLIKSEIIKKIGLFDTILKVSDDWDMWLKIAEAGYFFDFVPEYLVNYIQHGENLYLGNQESIDTKEFMLNYNNHKNSFTKYNLYGLGHYYLNKKNYKKSRKYYLSNVFSKESDIKTKTMSFIYVILTFFPMLEKPFKIILNKIKKLFKKIKLY